MSISFRIEIPEGRSQFGTIAEIGGDGVRCGDLSLEQELPIGEFLFYRIESSSRGIHVARDPSSVSVLVFLGSVPDDYELAFRFLERFAAPPDLLQSEDESFPVSALRARWDVQRISQQIETDFNAIATRVLQGNAVSISGPVREVHFGPRFLKQLTEAGPPAETATRAFEAVRRAQFVETEGYRAANILEVTPKGKATYTCSVWSEGERLLVPTVDCVELCASAHPKDNLLVPYTELAAVAGDRFSWLDEKQALLEAASGPDWQAIIARAHSRQVSATKRWWRWW